MISIDPYHLTDLDLNLSSIVAVTQSRRDGDQFGYPDMGRPDHGLCLVMQGEILYTDARGMQRTAAPGNVIYLPKGKRYRAEFVGEVRNILLNFILSDHMGRELTLGDDIVCMVSEVSPESRDLFAGISDCYRGGGTVMELKSMTYQLMSILFSRPLDRGDDAIEKCTAYVRSHYAEITEISELAAMCGYGETAFRKHFREKTGMSPVHYINALKIERACDMLRSSEMTVSGIGEFLGFYDIAYFHKVFKRYTGMTPGEYSRAFREGKA